MKKYFLSMYTKLPKTHSPFGVYKLYLLFKHLFRFCRNSETQNLKNFGLMCIQNHPIWKGSYDFTFEIASYTYFISKHDRTEPGEEIYYVFNILAETEGLIFCL